MIHKNISGHQPVIETSAYVHPLAAVIGNVFIGKRVMVSPCASVRGDEGQPLFIGDESNVQDGVVIHALETDHEGKEIEQNLVEWDEKKYAVYIGIRVSLAHQAHIHGPAFVGDYTFVGMKSLVFKSRVGTHCVIEPGCIILGVSIASGRYVPAGTTLKDQAAADNLPLITDDYTFKSINKEVVRVNTGLADGYNKTGPFSSS